MSQTDIYNFMRNLRLTKDDKFYTSKEIERMMARNHIKVSNISDKLTRLWWYNFIEKAQNLRKGKGKMYNRRLFRAIL